MTFNLIDEPWIPVLDRAGRRDDRSLREFFREALDIRDLAIAFVPERVAVTRLLVAVLQGALRGPESVARRTNWLDDPGSVQPDIDRYLDTWHHRFDLFSAHRPFMQQLVGDDVARDQSAAALVLDWASGNNVTLFDHHVDDRPPALTPADAGRALFTLLLYQPGGGVSTPLQPDGLPGDKAADGADARRQRVGDDRREYTSILGARR